MAIDPDLLSLMVTSIQVRERATRDAYGKSTWGDPATVICHLTRKTSLVRLSATEMVNSQYTAWCPGPGVVPDSDGATATITITTGMEAEVDGKWREIIAVEAPTDETGETHHQKIQMVM